MNFGKVILLGALFFGVRAVVKKDKTGSSGGGSDPGKTNDNGGTVDICEIVKKSPYLKKFVLSEDEMRKCESSILNEERKKILQSICKNINIANETDLNGLAGLKGYEWKKQMSGKEVITMLKKNGWEYVKTKGGSHQKYEKNGQTVVIPVHGNKPLKIGTLKSIKIRIAEIEKK